jgi:hypothetical protein
MAPRSLNIVRRSNEVSQMLPPPVNTRIRIVCLTVVALLVAQSLVIHRYSEPYPAIMMPAFPGSGGYRDGRVEISQYEAVFITEGETFSFPSKMLLEEFPDSLHGTIAKNALTPRSESPQTAQRTSQIALLRDAIFPGFGARKTSRDSPENFASLQDWLRGRARVLVPGRLVSRVEIRWFREKVTIAGTKFHTEREPTSTLVIPLNGGLR